MPATTPTTGPGRCGGCCSGPSRTRWRWRCSRAVPRRRDRHRRGGRRQDRAALAQASTSTGANSATNAAAEGVEVLRAAAGHQRVDARGGRRRRRGRPSRRRRCAGRSARLGHEVRVRPATRSPSMRVHGPWQMAATGLPASNIAMRKSTAAASVRSWSALATPPGQHDGVVVVGAHPVGHLVDREAVGPVEVAHRLDHPRTGCHQLGVPPASTTARQGRSSSSPRRPRWPRRRRPGRPAVRSPA